MKFVQTTRQQTVAIIASFSVWFAAAAVAQSDGQSKSTQTSAPPAVPPTGLSQFETVRYVTQFPCPASPGCKGNSDFGAQIMAAYTDCPSTGCRIRVPSNRSCWTYTTPLVFDNQGKNVILEGDGTTQTCLFFNARSGSAITIDTGGSVSSGESVFRNLLLLGRCSDSSCSEVTANGVVIGPTNGTGTLSFEDFQVGLQVGVPNTACPGRCGFLNGFLLGSAVVNLGLSFYNTSILSSHFAINANNQNYENLHWFGGFCAQNDYCFTGPSAGDYYFHSVSFDDNEDGAIRTTANAAVFCDNCHFENAGGGATSNYIQASGNSIIEVYGGAMYERRTHGGPYQGFVTFSGSNLIVDGLVVSSSGRQTVKQVVNASGFPGGIHLRILNTSPAYVENQLTPTYQSSRILDVPLRGDAGTATARLIGYHLTVGGHLQQVASGNYAGSCRMNNSNSCQFTITQGYRSPLCIATAQGSTPIAAACDVSSTTVTIRAASSNSLLWAAILVGNPN